MENKYPKDVVLVHPRNIIILPGRGRKDFSNLNLLMDSIQKHGLLHPCVAYEQDGKYVLIAGERRYRAMCLLGWDKIPCTLKVSVSELEQKEIELEENLVRQNLAWCEEIELRRRIDELMRQIHGVKTSGSKDDTGWTLKKTAEKVGTSTSTLTRQVAFAKFLQQRPDLKEQLISLPLSAAMKKADMIVSAERAKRQHEAGQLVLNTSLKLGNCLELIKAVPDKSIDLLLTDMPYGIDNLENPNISNTSKVAYKSLISNTDNLSWADAFALMKNLVPQLRRVLKPSAHFYIFTSISMFDEVSKMLIISGLLPEKVPLIWDKGRTTEAFKGYSYCASFEPIIFGHSPPRTKRLSEPSRNILQFPPEHSLAHPFAKPLALLTFLIKMSSVMGNTILDPFAGSGSTLIAAKRSNRSCIGFEINEQNYYNAMLRIDECLSDQQDQKTQKLPSSGKPQEK